MSKQSDESFVRRSGNVAIWGRAKTDLELNEPELQQKDDVVESIDRVQEVESFAPKAELEKNYNVGNSDDLQSHVSVDFLYSFTRNLTAIGKISSYFTPANETDFEFWSKYVDLMKAVDGYQVKVNQVFCIDGLHANTAAKSLGNHHVLMHGVHHSAVFDLLLNNFGESNGIGSKKSYFGRGFIFTDCSTKAFNFASHYKAYEHERKADEGVVQPKVGDVGYILVCDVALGTTFSMRKPQKDGPRLATHDSYCTDPRYKAASKLSVESPSLRYGPDHTASLPHGGLVANSQVYPNDRTTDYSEYSVYNTSQIEMKFLIEVERTG